MAKNETDLNHYSFKTLAGWGLKLSFAGHLKRRGGPHLARGPSVWRMCFKTFYDKVEQTVGCCRIFSQRFITIFCCSKIAWGNPPQPQEVGSKGRKRHRRPCRLHCCRLAEEIRTPTELHRLARWRQRAWLATHTDSWKRMGGDFAKGMALLRTI